MKGSSVASADVVTPGYAAVVYPRFGVDGAGSLYAQSLYKSSMSRRQKAGAVGKDYERGVRISLLQYVMA